jgi:hypothetical protein
MAKSNLATAGQTAAPKPKSPTGGQRPPSDSRGPVEAGNADTAPGIIVFGLDPTGKHPRQRRFRFSRLTWPPKPPASCSCGF